MLFDDDQIFRSQIAAGALRVAVFRGELDMVIGEVFSHLAGAPFGEGVDPAIDFIDLADAFYHGPC